MQSDSLKISGGYILICLIWGSTWLAIRIGLESLQPFISAGLRFITAALIIFTIMKVRGIKLQTDSLSLKLYLLLGFFSLGIPFGMVYWSEQYISSGLASIVFAVFPFFVLLFSKLFLNDQPIYSTQIIGVVLGFSGIVVIFSENLHIDLSKEMLGIAAVLTSSAIQGGMAVVIKKNGKHLNPFSMNLVPLVIAGLLLLSTSFIVESPGSWVFDYKAISSIIYLAFFGTIVTFSIYYWLLKRINVVLLALTTFITPIIAVILGFIVLGEKLSLQAFIGSGFVLVGILFANLHSIKNYYSSKKALND